MQINELKLKNSRKRKKFIGRGGKKGTYSGRGCKGQKARTGAHIDPLFEGGRSTLVDHMKKKRGFKSISEKALIIDVSVLENKFKAGELVNRVSLIKAGIIDKMEKRRIKLLGKHGLNKKIEIAGEILLSASAKEIIEKNGGSIQKEKKE